MTTPHTPHDQDKAIALLKSIAAPCEQSKRSAEHAWRKCRHCLAVAELEHDDVRALLSAFLADATAQAQEIYELRARQEALDSSGEAPLWRTLEDLRRVAFEDGGTPQENFGFLLAQVDRLLCLLANAEARCAVLTQAAQALVDKLYVIVPIVDGYIHLSHIRSGGQYDGPNLINELVAVRALLAKPEERT